MEYNEMLAEWRNSGGLDRDLAPRRAAEARAG
jgi:hypothetical protein